MTTLPRAAVPRCAPWLAALTAALLCSLAPAGVRAEALRPGLGLAVAGGLNVTHPFVRAELGWRFARAEFLELYGEYSLNAAISTFPFHTLGVGVRTYFTRFGRVALYAQASAGLAIASGGSSPAPSRTLGERLLGAFMTQGVGLDLALVRGLSAGLSVSTGYPVWLRPELSLRWRF